MFYKEIEVAKITAIAVQAGKAIMEIYAQPFEVEIKADTSPLTLADKTANAIILENLIILHPDIPFISEETKLTPFAERKNWNRFWLIDPLDGTKEFIKKNGEFTVNIALIEDGIPVIGIVYVPAQGITYLGVKGHGAFKQTIKGEVNKIENNIHYSTKQEIIVVGSRSHLSPETLAFVETLKAEGKTVSFSSSGSSLKLCLVAEGAADVYPRFSPTMEWDTAAAHAVALYAGKQVLNYETNEPLIYNKQNLLNPWFIVA